MHKDVYCGIVCKSNNWKQMSMNPRVAEAVIAKKGEVSIDQLFKLLTETSSYGSLYMIKDVGKKKLKNQYKDSFMYREKSKYGRAQEVDCKSLQVRNVISSGGVWGAQGKWHKQLREQSRFFL